MGEGGDIHACFHFNISEDKEVQCDQREEDNTSSVYVARIRMNEYLNTNVDRSLDPPHHSLTSPLAHGVWILRIIH